VSRRACSYWLPCTDHPLACFHASFGSDRPTVPGNASVPGSFSLATVLLQSSFLRSPAPCLSAGDAPAQVFAPLRGMTAARPLHAEDANLRYVPPSGFLNLSTVYSAPRRCRSVSPRNHVQDSRPVQGLLSPRSRDASSAPRCPLAVEPASLCISKGDAPTKTASRLRGFHPRGDAFRGFGS
jgi:hypothetical protein